MDEFDFFNLELDPLGIKRHLQKKLALLSGTNSSHDSLNVENRFGGCERQVEDLAHAEEVLSGDDPELPPHLQRYGRRYRNDREFSGPSILRHESDEGAIEYKLRLGAIDNFAQRFQHLVTQMQFRLSEGDGECFYYIGVEDNGFTRGLDDDELQTSLETLESMANEVGAAVKVLRYPPGAEGRRCAIVSVRSRAHASVAPTEVRIAVAGSVDAGKSTLVAVLSNGSDGKASLDNGRGAARMAVLRHKHEIESGRTSCITHCIVGYGQEGEVLNYSGVSSPTPQEMAVASRRLVRLSDMGGHERYHKTSVHGMTSTLPDYVMLCVCALGGLSWVTLEHLAVAMALGAPAFVVITKADTASPDRIEALAEEISGVVKAARMAAEQGSTLPEASASNETDSHAAAEQQVTTAAPIIINTSQATEVALRSASMSPRDFVVPVFAVSSVNGTGLNVLHSFLNALPCTACTGHNEDEPVRFQVDSIFEVAGVGSVLSGVVLSGRVATGDRLLLGPGDDEKFDRVRVTGLHRAQAEVSCVLAGQHATVAIDPVTDDEYEYELDTEDVDNAFDGLFNGGDPLSARVERDATRDGDLKSFGVGSSSNAATPVEAGRWHPVDENGYDDQAATGRSSTTRFSTNTPSSTGVDSKPPGLCKVQASAADLEVLGKSWDAALRLRSSPSSRFSFTGATPPPHGLGTPRGRLHAGGAASPRARKGAILLSPALRPTAVWRFEAVVVVAHGSVLSHGSSSGNLLAGGSPAGGKSMPSLACSSSCERLGALLESHGSWSDGGAEAVDRPLRRDRRSSAPLGPPPQFIAHCGGVRQAVRVCETQNLEDQAEFEEEYWQTVAGACRAATGVLSGSRSEAPGHASPPSRGVVATRVCFEFLHRRECLFAGMRLIVRERSSGRVAGAGCVVAVGAIS